MRGGRAKRDGFLNDSDQAVSLRSTTPHPSCFALTPSPARGEGSRQFSGRELVDDRGALVKSRASLETRAYIRSCFSIRLSRPITHRHSPPLPARFPHLLN